MLHRKARVLLLLGWAAIWMAQPSVSQDLDASKARELKIPSTEGEPSFSLQIWAEGRKGVVTVRDERGTEVQSLMCPLLLDNAEATQEELAAVREQFVTQFLVTDFDFDRHLDMAGVREFGAKWARYCVWLYDPKQHIFIKDFLAEQMELLTNLKPLADGQISSSHMGLASNWLAVYRVASAEGSRPQRQLIPMYSCLVESTPNGEKPTAIVTTRYEGGQAVVRRQKAVRMELSAALGECNFGAQAATTLRVLSLNRANNGQRVFAKVGQPVVVTLQTICGGQYGAPQISSRSLRFESASFPAIQNPGGPTQVYRFTAVASGQVKVEIPHSNATANFSLTIQVTRH
jgi:hypothetical protein